MRIGRISLGKLNLVIILVIGVSTGVLVSGGDINLDNITSKLSDTQLLGPNFQELASNPSNYETATISGTLEKTSPGFGVGEFYIEKNGTRIYVRPNDCDLKLDNEYTVNGEIYEVSVGKCSGTFANTTNKWCMEQNRKLEPETVYKSAALRCESTGVVNIGSDVEKVETDYTCSEVRSGAALAYRDPEAGEDAIEMGCKNKCNSEGMNYYGSSCTDGLVCKCTN